MADRLSRIAELQAWHHANGPLHLAVQNTGRNGNGTDLAHAGPREIIEEFYGYGVRPWIKDGKGKSGLDWVKSG
jgi:hypothetical protein